MTQATHGPRDRGRPRALSDARPGDLAELGAQVAYRPGTPRRQGRSTTLEAEATWHRGTGADRPPRPRGILAARERGIKGKVVPVCQVSKVHRRQWWQNSWDAMLPRHIGQWESRELVSQAAWVPMCQGSKSVGYSARGDLPGSLDAVVGGVGAPAGLGFARGASGRPGRRAGAGGRRAGGLDARGGRGDGAGGAGGWRSSRHVGRAPGMLGGIDGPQVPDAPDPPTSRILPKRRRLSHSAKFR